MAGEQPPAAGELPALVKRPPRPVRAEDEDADEREGEDTARESVTAEPPAAVAVAGDGRMAAAADTIPGGIPGEPQPLAAAPAEMPTPPSVAVQPETALPPLAEVTAHRAVEGTPPSPHAGNGLDQPAEQAILRGEEPAITEAAAEAPATDEAVAPVSPSSPELEAAPGEPPGGSSVS